MQLSRFTDYSLRVLFYVASHNDQRCTLAEIAQFYQISIEHLRKVVHSLSKANYLATFRGKNGGILLNRSPEQINIGEVIRHTEGMSPLIDCEAQKCCLSGFCSLDRALHEAQKAFYNVLHTYTLADLLQKPEMQHQLIDAQLVD